MKPLAVELFAGKFGWGEGLVAEGWRVIGCDIVHEEWHKPVPEGCSLWLQDVLTLSGAQFRDASLIVASPPCQAYSYRAMPWKRAKALPPPSNDLFDACFRIQREASEAAGRYIPIVIENVKGAQPWVGRAKWHYGSFYLWGDVPALMPMNGKFKNGDTAGGTWFGQSHGKKYDWRVQNPRDAAHIRDGIKGAEPVGTEVPPGTGKTSWFFGARADPRDMRKSENGEYTRMGKTSRDLPLMQDGHRWCDFCKYEFPEGLGKYGCPNCNGEGGIKQAGLPGPAWFDHGAAKLSSRSAARKAASAQIAKIPISLARHIARVYYPEVSK